MRLSGETRDQAHFLLVLLTGLWLILFGLLRLGRLTRYISHSVITGFLAGVAALLVLDQLAPFVGYTPQGPNELLQVLDLLQNVELYNPRAIEVGTMALLITIGLNRTPPALVSTLVALAVPSLVVALFG